MLVGLEEGTYFYKSRGTGEVCGVYLLSQPDEAVQVSFDYLNVDCDSDGLVSVSIPVSLYLQVKVR